MVFLDEVAFKEATVKYISHSAGVRSSDHESDGFFFFFFFFFFFVFFVFFVFSLSSQSKDAPIQGM